jgi:VanZ family protein
VSEDGYFAHFNVGFLIGGLVYYLFFKKTVNKIKSLVFGILIATFFGIGKELIDPYLGRNVDIYDLMYTVLGGVVGAVIVLAIKIFWQKKKGQEKKSSSMIDP